MVVVGDTLIVVVIVTVGVAETEGERVSVGVMLAEIVADAVPRGVEEHAPSHSEPICVIPDGHEVVGAYERLQVPLTSTKPAGHSLTCGNASVQMHGRKFPGPGPDRDPLGQEFGRVRVPDGCVMQLFNSPLITSR